MSKKTAVKSRSPWRQFNPGWLGKAARERMHASAAGLVGGPHSRIGKGRS